MKKRPLLWIVLGTLSLVFLFVAGYLYHTCGTALCDDGKSEMLYIDQDDDIDSVYHKLNSTSAKGNIGKFRKVAKWAEYGDAVRVGRYEIGRGAAVWTVVRNLRNGIQTPVMLPITEVWTLENLAARLSKRLMADSAELIQVFTDTAMCVKYGVKPETMVCLFIPNTYEIYWNITPEKFLERMYQEFNRYWNAERVAKAKAKGLTPYEATTLASIVYKETMKAEENPIVAGLYLNRLKKGMKLQACPTVKFALKDFGLRRILNRHLQVESPYNTYKYAGLPPGPICIPSLNSIEAVLNAADHDYLYMCAKEDFSKTHNFASTGAEHEANARKYQKALNERGIKK